MKEINKNEELQSRREFFKKAAKGVLPILGAVVLANMPVMSNAATPMGCGYGCSNYCHGSCMLSCENKCHKSCKATCQDDCNYRCKGTCKGTSK